MSLKRDSATAALAIGAVVAVVGFGGYRVLRGMVGLVDRPMSAASQTDDTPVAPPPLSLPSLARAESTAPAAMPAQRPDPVEDDEPPSQREDVEAWVARGDASKLTTLLAIDVSKDLDAAPAVIMGIATFSKDASPDLKKRAAAHLGKMLGSERTRAESRDMRGAAGNVATGIDALGEMATPEAGAELTRALDTGSYALHHETRMVQELTKQKYAPARAAVERFAKRTKARSYEDSFDQELQKEALEAADEALATMSR